MRDFNKIQSSKWIFFFIPLTVVLCISLSALTHVVPSSAVSQNVKDSLSSFSSQVSYPKIIQGYTSTQLDDFTDAIILNTASYAGEEPVLEKMAANYRIKNGDSNTSLHSYGRNDVGKTTYNRYWIGSIFFVKVLLLFLEYPNIQMLNQIMQLVLLTVFVCQMTVHKLSKYLVPFIGSILWLMPIILPLSLQFSPVYYVMLISMLVLLRMYSPRKEYYSYTRSTFVVLFACIGIITNWIDFLTYPLITLGFPLVLLLILRSYEQKDLNYGEVILICLSWGLGYASMWILKWLFATLILHRNVFQEAFDAILFRTSRNTADVAFTRIDVIWKNIRVMWKRPVLLGFIGMLCFCLKNFTLNTHKTRVQRQSLMRRTLCYGITALLPFAWYLVLGNHSYIHYWFTYRTLSITLLASFSYLLICNDRCDCNN